MLLFKLFVRVIVLIQHCINREFLDGKNDWKPVWCSAFAYVCTSLDTAYTQALVQQ